MSLKQCIPKAIQYKGIHVESNPKKKVVLSWKEQVRHKNVPIPSTKYRLYSHTYT